MLAREIDRICSCVIVLYLDSIQWFSGHVAQPIWVTCVCFCVMAVSIFPSTHNEVMIRRQFESWP